MPVAPLATAKVSEFLDLGVKVVKPTWVNYGRVFLDVVMIGLLLLVVARSVRVHNDDPKMAIHVHQVPVYLKHGVDYDSMWRKASGSTELDDAGKLLSFRTDATAACVGAATHPTCMCITNSTSLVGAKNCIVQNPRPQRYSNWNVGSVSSAMVLWFLASFATSVGTLPWINSYIIHGDNKSNGPETVFVFRRVIVGMYVVITICALTAPLIVTAIQFPNSKPHMDAVLNMLMWSVLTVFTLAIYNYETLFEYFTWLKVEHTEHAGTFGDRKKMSVHNWILYVHLLVAAPAIAMVLHINQGWTEYHTIINTTLVISTIFAVDAFSAEMANFWTAEAKRADFETSERAKGGMQSQDDEKAKIMALHKRLGLIRLFTWVVNGVMLLLLFTLAYPLEIEHQKTSSALFVVMVVMFAAVFLAPDLVREFTQRVAFNNIQFRLYGDFMLRALALFFIWRSSVMPRTM
jgi:hypothetical protein